MKTISIEEARRREKAKAGARQPDEPPLHTNGHASPSVILRDAASYDMRPIDWLWKGWLARGKFHILAGVPGTAKTTLALNFAAILSTGGFWADGTRAPQGNVVIWSSEDDVEDTLLPRLVAAGADLNRIKFVAATTDEKGPRPFDPAHDLKKLGAAIDLTPPLAVILDPVSAANTGDSHKSAEVRRELQPFVDLAVRHHFAAVGIHHFNKGTQGREPLERLLGAGAYGALPRMVLVATAAAKVGDPFRLVRVKSNIGPRGGCFEYQLIQHLMDIPGDQRVEAQSIEWGSYVEGTPKALLAIEEIDVQQTERERGVEFLREFLAHGRQPTTVIEDAGKAHGISAATLRRAKTQLNAKVIKLGLQEGWAWELPPLQNPIDAEGDHQC